ncbi:MAG: hypothetical protein HYS55_02040 [Candidatus Omnitrophica bacterium]|nr:hypothetical protein [Candidatus Omnitrophota bacterium]
MAKGKPGFNLSQITTIAIYVFLVGTLVTYALPIMSVTLPALGKKSWSVRDIVSVIPKSLPSGKEEKGAGKLSTDYDFTDLLKEILPKDPQTKAPAKVSVELIAGLLVPVALALAYLVTILNLLVAVLKKGSVFIVSSAAAAICACYTLVGTFYLAQVAERAFSSSIAKVEDSPFGSLLKNVVQQVTIQPETGLFVLSLLTIVVFGIGLYRKSALAR